ncbi:tetratricopeptide repeat protein [Micromonospora sp. D93]|uniref:tetratricopeptide repeat protein n=1 Tax=Micromonospora sp. D93 TaxID=2824886 RepID=UPI001B36D527|nr:tetratricopeptide repeat protein [Micromonospora sp. D93]
MLWAQHITRTAWVEAWNKVTDPHPARDPVSAGDSLLAALNPDQQIVAFSPLRERDLRRLVHWWTEPGTQRIWLVSGAAGCGKTRLLIEAISRLDQSWTIGWVGRGKGADAAKLAVARGEPVLLIVDDADTHPDLAAMLTTVYDSTTVLVLAAARTVETWWPRLRESLNADVDAMVPARAQTILDSLTSDAATQQQRFTQAVRYFADGSDTAATQASLIPADPPAGLLLVHAAAAVAVHDNLTGPITLDRTVDRLFTIEEAWWQRNAAAAKLPAVGLPALRAVVMAGVLLGADGLGDATEVLRRLPGLTGSGDDLLHDLVLWLRKLYPTRAGSWLDPHLPARLTEHFIATHLVTNPALLTAIADLTLPLTSPTSPTRAVRVLTIAAAAAQHTPAAADSIRQLLYANPRLLQTAIRVALTGTGPIDQAIADAIDTIPLDPGDLAAYDEALPATTNQTLLHTPVAISRARLARADTDDQRALHLHRLGARLSALGRREEALTATREAVDVRRRLAVANPAAFDSDLARSLSNLGLRLSDLGRREEALTATREAVDTYRRLAVANPAAFNHVLGVSLNNLGGDLSGLGRREEALTAASEAVDIHRRLVAANPAKFDHVLAVMLNVLGAQLMELGRREEALSAGSEAVSIARRLVAANPAAFNPDLARSLHNLGVWLSDLGRHEEALTAAREAVDIDRRLATGNPAAFDPKLATSLNGLGSQLMELRRHKEALTATREAVDINRRLATGNPAAFDPELATSLHNLSRRLSALGRHEEALTAAREAVDIDRRLATGNPAAFDPKLATLLDGLGTRLSALGRHEEALTAAREAVDINRRLAATNSAAFDPGLAQSLHNLGLWLSALGRHDEALTAASEAVDIYRRLDRHMPHVFHNVLLVMEHQLRRAQAFLGQTPDPSSGIPS